MQVPGTALMFAEHTSFSTDASPLRRKQPKMSTVYFTEITSDDEEPDAEHDGEAD